MTVLRRSVCIGGGFGGGVDSTLAEELLESHEKGPASFLVGGAGCGVTVCVVDCFGAGGGPHGTEGRDPENPCDRKGIFAAAGRVDAEGAGVGSSVLTSSLVTVFDLDLLSSALPSACVALVAGVSPSCTSSKEEVEIRRAVSKGDFALVSSDSVSAL